MILLFPHPLPHPYARFINHRQHVHHFGVAGFCSFLDPVDGVSNPEFA